MRPIARSSLLLLPLILGGCTPLPLPPPVIKLWA